MSETTGMPACSPELKQLLADLVSQRRLWAAQPCTGRRCSLPRCGKPPVEVLLYRPDTLPETPLPVVFNMHGGAWIGGDAVLLDSFCQLVAQQLPALVVNVNYTKADVKPFPFAQQEVADAVLYLAEHAEEYGIDPARMAVCGHSAGAHIAAGAALLLRDAGFALAAQVLVYPALDMRTEGEGVDRDIAQFLPIIFPNGDQLSPLASPLLASDDFLRGQAPAVILVCGQDTLRSHGLGYAERLRQLGIPVLLKEYETALHGFIEVNRPDYPADERQTPEQEALCRDAEQWLIGCMHQLL